jgi:hypothetical protein
MRFLKVIAFRGHNGGLVPSVTFGVQNGHPLTPNIQATV